MEKIEFQAVSFELKPASPHASWPTSVGRVCRMVVVRQHRPTLPCHKGEHSVSLALTPSFTLSLSPSRSRVAPEQSKAQRCHHRIVTQSTSHVALP